MLSNVHPLRFTWRFHMITFRLCIFGRNITEIGFWVPAGLPLWSLLTCLQRVSLHHHVAVFPILLWATVVPPPPASMGVHPALSHPRAWRLNCSGRKKKRGRHNNGHVFVKCAKVRRFNFNGLRQLSLFLPLHRRLGDLAMGQLSWKYT